MKIWVLLIILICRLVMSNENRSNGIKNLFFHLLDISVLYSYILYREQTDKTINFYEFRLQLVCQIIKTYGKPKASSGCLNTGDNPVRLNGCHFPSLIPSTLAKQNPRTKCLFCAKTIKRAKKMTDTGYEWIECDVGLCISDCFQDYHPLKHF
jgi:hypothetical protein